ncbi:MAG: BatA and WFA domain-containing protein [Phycisphaerae bacterium]|nr:BatA and WFA domain-containing protein [Phycisphaerae bacterium]
MTVVHPALLAAGLACIAIPIIIHFLTRRRRTPIEFGAMRFLIEAYRKSRRRLLVERLLLLALRAALVAAVAAAIARPMLGGGDALSGPRTLFLLLDDSLTATAREAGSVGPDSNAAAFARQRVRARSALDQLREGDRAALILLSTPARSALGPPSADLAGVRAALDAAAPTDARADLAGGLSLLAELARGADTGATLPGSSAIVFSDLLAGSADLRARAPALPDALRLISTPPRAGASANVTLADTRAERAFALDADGTGVTVQATVTLHRSGSGDDREAVTRLRLETAPGTRFAGAPSGPGIVSGPETTVRWTPGQRVAQARVRLELPGAGGDARVSGSIPLLARVLDPDAVEGDNTFRLAIRVRRALSVVLAAPRRPDGAISADTMDAAEWWRLALRPAPNVGIDITDVDPALIDVAVLGQADAVVLPRPDLLGEETWARLRQFVSAGNLLIVSPPPQLDVHVWTDAFTRRLSLPIALGKAATRHEDDAAPVTLAAPELTAADEESRQTDVLAALRGELASLARGVSVFRSLPPELSGGVAPAGHAALRLSDATTLLWIGPPGREEAPDSGAPAPRGLVAYLSVAPDLTWSDLPARPLMVPLAQELVRQGVGLARGEYTAIAGSHPLAPASSIELAPVAAGTGDTAALTVEPASGRTSMEVRRSGQWTARDARGTERAIVSVNPDPRAGDTSPVARAALEEFFVAAAGGRVDRFAWLADPVPTEPFAPDRGTTLERAVRGASEGTPVSVWLLIAAGTLALAETALARRASHARPEARASAADAGRHARPEVRHPPAANPGEVAA